MVDSWKDWQSLLNYTHIIVATRPDDDKNISDELKIWQDKNRIDDIKILKTTLSGYIFYINTSIVKIPSSMIRKYYSEHKNIGVYLPTNIITYIKDNNLYMDN